MNHIHRLVPLAIVFAFHWTMFGCSPSFLVQATGTPLPTPKVARITTSPAIETSSVAASTVVPTTPRPTNTIPATALTRIPTPAAKEMQILIQFIIDELAGSEKKDRYIAQVEAGGSTRAPLQVSESSIRYCWHYQDGTLASCATDVFLDNFRREDPAQMRHSYAIFAVMSVDQAYSQATVRLDMFAGRLAAAGTLVTLKRSSGSWQVQSRQALWSG